MWPRPPRPYDGDLLAGTGVPALERGVRGDAGAQQRGGLVQGDALGDAEDEVLVDDDLLGVAAVGGLAVLADAVVRHHVAARAVLLPAGLAVPALAAGVDHAADAHPVADGELGDAGADLGDDARDLVAGDHREDGLAPALTDLVDVGVADAGELDVDQDVMFTHLAPLDGGALQRRLGGGCCVRGDSGHAGFSGFLLA
ncbi:hypothetical protein RKD37_003778 [Streptomyces ambofaciens]